MKSFLLFCFSLLISVSAYTQCKWYSKAMLQACMNAINTMSSDDKLAIEDYRITNDSRVTDLDYDNEQSEFYNLT